MIGNRRLPIKPNNPLPASPSEDVDEVRVVGDNHAGSAAIDGGELKARAVLAEPDSLYFALLHCVQELAVSPLGTFREVRGGLGLGLRRCEEEVLRER